MVAQPTTWQRFKERARKLAARVKDIGVKVGKDIGKKTLGTLLSATNQKAVTAAYDKSGGLPNQVLGTALAAMTNTIQKDLQDSDPSLSTDNMDDSSTVNKVKNLKRALDPSTVIVSEPKRSKKIVSTKRKKSSRGKKRKRGKGIFD